MSRIFDITISQTLSKNTWAETKDYVLEYDMLDEEGPRPYYNLEYTDWYKVIKTNDILTPLELLEEFKKHLEYDLEYEALTEQFYKGIKEKGCSERFCHYVWDVQIALSRGYGFKKWTL